MKTFADHPTVRSEHLNEGGCYQSCISLYVFSATLPLSANEANDMRLHRLMVCSMVGFFSLSVAAFAADHSRKSPLKYTPRVAAHHGSYKPVAEGKTGKKPQFWNHK